ncbi:MAG: hypothetical protein HYZ86_01870 [Candidatus Omnitrophica bacterium]|nr:hypothetical protein [Candidatus Omnitrophota bacterium]
MLKKKRGQSTVEYVLLATAVIAVMIAFATNKDTGLQKKLTDTLGTSANTIGNMTGRLHKSQQGSNTVIPTPAQSVVGFDPTTGFNSTQ